MGLLDIFRVSSIKKENEELKELSLEAKVLYAFMCDRIGLSVKNGWTDEIGCIFIIYSVAEVCEKLGCKKDKARKILSELEHFGRTGLIRRKKQGLGRPDKIFVVEIKEEVVERPKALGDIRGVTYIYGMFYRFGLIDVPDEVKEKMGHPKKRKKTGCYVQKCAVICAITEDVNLSWEGW